MQKYPRKVSFMYSELLGPSPSFTFVAPSLGSEELDNLEDFAPAWLPPTEPVQMAVIYQDKKGKTRVKGGKDLKGSQSYPIQLPVRSIYDMCFVLNMSFSALTLYSNGVYIFCALPDPNWAPLLFNGLIRLLPAPRFGRSLSKLRTSMRFRHARAARAAMKQNLKFYQSVARNTRADARWIKQANLKPVLDFL